MKILKMGGSFATAWCTVACLMACASVAAASEDSVHTTKAIAIQVAPYYLQAAPGLLPTGFVNKGDTAVIEKVSVDSMGTAWFALVHRAGCVFSPASHWRYVGAITDDVSEERVQDEEDRKRRLRILQQHRDWPRRIIRAVREGKICLDMSPEQLEASWCEPVQKSRCFTVGLGEHEVWFYSGLDGKMLMVSLQNGRVIGWSLGGGAAERDEAKKRPDE